MVHVKIDTKQNLRAARIQSPNKPPPPLPQSPPSHLSTPNSQNVSYASPIFSRDTSSHICPESEQRSRDVEIGDDADELINFTNSNLIERLLGRLRWRRDRIKETKRLNAVTSSSGRGGSKNESSKRKNLLRTTTIGWWFGSGKSTTSSTGLFDDIIKRRATGGSGGGGGGRRLPSGIQCPDDGKFFLLFCFTTHNLHFHSPIYIKQSSTQSALQSSSS